jgi:hypothetical protein
MRDAFNWYRCFHASRQLGSLYPIHDSDEIVDSGSAGFLNRMQFRTSISISNNSAELGKT